MSSLVCYSVEKKSFLKDHSSEISVHGISAIVINNMSNDIIKSKKDLCEKDPYSFYCSNSDASIAYSAKLHAANAALVAYNIAKEAFTAEVCNLGHIEIANKISILEAKR
jgi:hypothetical protein